MPIETITRPPELVVEHNGVKVYRCYGDDDINFPSRYWFTTNPLRTEEGNPESFCVDNLDHARVLDSRKPPPYDQLMWRKLGLRSPHEYLMHPHYLFLQAKYHEWEEDLEPSLIRNILIQAIINKEI